MKEDSMQKLPHFLDPNISKEDLAELLKDPKMQREYFELIRIKTLLGSLDPKNFPISQRQTVIPWKRAGAFLLAVASFLIVFSLFLFYQKREESYKVIGNLKASHGNCEQSPSSDHWIGYQTKENSYCDLLLEGMGTFSIRIFPNTRMIVETSPDNLKVSILEGSILFSSVYKKEGITVEANSPHIRSILLGTSLFVSASLEKERIFLLEGSIQVGALGVTDDSKSTLIKSGTLAETTNWIETAKPEEIQIQVNPISAKEESILLTQFDSMRRIRENQGFTDYQAGDLKSIETVHESEKWSNRPYVQIKSTNGLVQEGYLIEIGDFYSIQTVDSGLIRLPKTSISEISTLRK